MHLNDERIACVAGGTRRNDAGIGVQAEQNARFEQPLQRLAPGWFCESSQPPSAERLEVQITTSGSIFFCTNMLTKYALAAEPYVQKR